MDKINIRTIAEMCDHETLALFVKKPHHPLGTGFYYDPVFSLRDFENEQEMSDCLCALKNRLAKIGKA